MSRPPALGSFLDFLSRASIPLPTHHFLRAALTRQSATIVRYKNECDSVTRENPLTAVTELPPDKAQFRTPKAVKMRHESSFIGNAGAA